MRFAQVNTPQGLRTHMRALDGGYIDVAAATGDQRLASLDGLISVGQPALEAVSALLDHDGSAVDPSNFGPAVPNPRRVLCLGRNYREHALEVAHLHESKEIPSWPETFVRGPDSVLGPYANLVRPALTTGLDFEGELGVVLKSGGRYVRAAEAAPTIFGYVVLNDVTARDWQRAGMQWTPGKNFDGSMPVGPELVTADELDITDLQLTTTLNGKVMQSARTSQMLVGIHESIEFFSSFTSLRGGDMIATGTPGGVGFARKPPIWLNPGDVIEVDIEHLGSIRNVVVEESASPAQWPWKPASRPADTAAARR
jgi:acylpyruvate hydrolase